MKRRVIELVQSAIGNANIQRIAIRFLVVGGVMFQAGDRVLVLHTACNTFADCAVVPDPDVTQLADIAISTAENHRRLTGEEPRVAMLSFSTRGSASHPFVEKVQQATAKVREKQPSLLVDGDLQLDAAASDETVRVEPIAPIIVRPDTVQAEHRGR